MTAGGSAQDEGRAAELSGRRTSRTLHEVLGLTDEQVREHHERLARAFDKIAEAERRVTR